MICGFLEVSPLKSKFIIICLTALFTVLLLTACGRSKDPVSELDSLKSEIKALISENKAFKKQIKKLERELASLKKSQTDVSDTSEADLDGDGETDYITLRLDEEGGFFELSVNNMIISGAGYGSDIGMEIVDLDSEDLLKEVAVYYSGSMPCTDFYRYTSDGIVSLGRVSGTIDSIEIIGDGSIIAEIKSSLLEGLVFPGPLSLTDGRLIPEPPESGLYMISTEVRVLKPITINVEGTDSNMTLIVGEELILVQSDNESKVLLETQTGLQSWLNIDKNYMIMGTAYKLNEVFEIIH